MQLKEYQQLTLRDLEQYIDVLNQSNSLQAAYSQYWNLRGVSLNAVGSNFLRPYVNSVGQVPRVTLKVPTAGGKTFIACHALRRIADRLHTDAPGQVVAWFVPSDTILKQTLEKLQDPSHPYRQTLDALFAHRVTVADKEAALMGQGMSPALLRENLTILVLSAQSFVETVRAKQGKAAEQQKPRVYRENGYLMDHVATYGPAEPHIEGAAASSLIEVLAHQRPLVIVDESHNFKTDLRVDLLNNLRPRFILELTATPRDNSNIVSIVDAMQLKRENMVKLPVIVENRNTAADVIVNAISLRNSLEQHARAMEQQGGRYIRPIVLFQAQPKSDDDNVTFDRIRHQLIDLGLPEEQIKIKNASTDELEGLDLMSRDCPVRYIITVNALKEGWDCPFAYILATVANRTSRVDVEQILGRILRQPYTMQHSDPLLNLSYVFTCSNDFRETVENIIISLQKAGYSRKDFREITPAATPATPVQNTIRWQPDTPEPADMTDDALDFTDSQTEAMKQQLASSNNADQRRPTESIEARAQRAGEEYNKLIEKQAAKGSSDPIAAFIPQEMSYPINDNYKAVAAGLNLPIFVVRTARSLFFDSEWIPLEKTMLTEGFNLPASDATVDFSIARPTGVAIDIDQAGDDYIPIRRTNQQAMDYIRQLYMNRPVAEQKNALSRQLASMIKLDCVAEPQIKKYVDRVIDTLDDKAIDGIVDNIYLARDAIQQKIASLIHQYQRQVFGQWLDIGKIALDNQYTFLDEITIARDTMVGIGKGLYAAEEKVSNNFEYNVVAAIADCPNVLFWHRNRERRDFCINGFINHYPDFIVQTHSGITVLVETKGDHLANNDDTRHKIWLGNKWADLAGPKYRYFMVFQSHQEQGAITINLLLQYLNELK